MEYMNEINTTASLQGNEVPPIDTANGSQGYGTSASDTTSSAAVTSAAGNRQGKVLERKNGMIAGVAGGIADYFDIDATIVRLILVGIALVTMPAIPLAYIVAWIIIPEEGKAVATGSAEGLPA